jgi:hypothetical protein
MMLDPTGRHKVGVHMTHSDHRSIANLRSQFRRGGLETGDRTVPVTSQEEDHIPAELLENSAAPQEVPVMPPTQRHPTEHFVKEALRHHVDKTVTCQILVGWVRKEHGVVLAKSSVSSSLSRICKGDTNAEVKLTRLSLGVYQVGLLGVTAPQGPAVPPQVFASAAIARGDLIEVVHIAMDGNIYGTDQAGNLYRLHRIV